MSGYYDSRGDRYAPPPRQRESSMSSSRQPPSGPSRPPYSSGPPPASSSIGQPPRHPSYSRSSYESAPRGPRYADSTPLHPRSYDPPRRPTLSLWSTQNPAGRDGYHHSGQPSSQSRSYTPSTYRDHDGYDRDYRSRFSTRGNCGNGRNRDGSRDLYPPGPRDYRDQSRHTSSYHPNYSTSPSPPTGPRHGYSSYQPPRPEPRSRERTPSGPAAWSARSSTTDRRYYDTHRQRDHSPAPSLPSRPRTPPYSARRDDYPPRSPIRRESLERRKSEEKPIIPKSSTESVKQESRPQSPDVMEDVKQPLQVEPEEDTLTQDDVDQRIRQIDQEMESTEQRIAEIQVEKDEHERQIQLLHEQMHIPIRVTEMKAEIAEDETEEEMTPVEEEPKKDRPRTLKRPRSEPEDDQENIRVRIWRMLTETAIKHEGEEQVEKFTITMSTEPMKIIERVEDLSDAEESAKRHQDSRHAIFRTLYIRKKRQQYRQDKLRRAYGRKYAAWQEHMNKLDTQRQRKMEEMQIQPKIVEPPLTPRVESGIPPGTPGTENAAPAAGDGIVRGTRRAQQAAHARDYVQSEAEFLELMQSLGTEQKDPTAEVPPMLPPDERGLIDFDESGLIGDPVEFYTRALFTVDDGSKVNIKGWSEEEDKIYLRRLSIAGKQFGRFRKAALLQNRSVQELVQHYYFLKGDGEGFDWRNVIAGKNRYSKLGRAGAPGVLLGSGAPKPRGSGGGRGRGRSRAGGITGLLQPRREYEDDDRSAADDDADDSGSITTERVRAARVKRGRVIESTAAKQRPKRSTGPILPKEKGTIQVIAPSPVPSTLEEPSRRNYLVSNNSFAPSFNQVDLAMSTDRDSSAPPGGGENKKRERGKLPQTSSYWRVNEMEMFPKHLSVFGRNWQKIAEEMGTKTAQQVKNYFSKNADALGFNKIVDDFESGLTRPAPALVPKVEIAVEMPRPPEPPVPSTYEAGRPEPQVQQLPSAPPKALPTVASLLNSPVREMSRSEHVAATWPEPLAPTPVPLSNTLLSLPETVQDRIRSPSNASEISRSQSQGDFYARGSQSMYSQPSIQSQPIHDDREYYRDDPRSQNISSSNRYVSPHQSLLPPVRIHGPQQSPYYPNTPSPYDRMPPPSISEQGYIREPYSRSPIQHRPTLPSLPPAIPPSDTRTSYYPREPERRPELPPRYPLPYREEMGYERPADREYYRREHESTRYSTRDRYHREVVESELQADRERDRIFADREREWRERYPPQNYPPRTSTYRARSPERMYTRESDRDYWDRFERERLERDRLDKWTSRR